MGISATESGDLVSSFMLLNLVQKIQPLNLVKSSQEFAKQNGIIPGQLMENDLSKINRTIRFIWRIRWRKYYKSRLCKKIRSRDVSNFWYC